MIPNRLRQLPSQEEIAQFRAPIPGGKSQGGEFYRLLPVLEGG